MIHHWDATKFDWPNADVMITDPPYRADVYKRATSQSKVRGTRHRDLGHAPITQDLLTWTCQQAAKVKRWSCVFADVESTTLWVNGLSTAGATYIRTIPWVRWSMPQLSGDRPPQGFECIVVAYGHGKGRKHWNGPGNLTHMNAKAMRGESKHKCEKPLDLIRQLVEWFSDEGETVIDPFAGAGTVSLACKLLGRVCVATEVSSEWAMKANERLAGPLSKRDSERLERVRA